MKKEDFKIEKGYERPVKYDFLVAEITGVSIFKSWIPDHLQSEESLRTTITVEAFPSELPASVVETMDYFLNHQSYFESVINKEILKYYLDVLYPSVFEEGSYYKEGELEEFPKLSPDDERLVKNYNHLHGIYFPLHKSPGQFGLMFHSQWEEEHDIGLSFNEFKFNSIGEGERAMDAVSHEKKIIQQEQLKAGVIMPVPPPVYMHLPDLDYTVHWRWDYKSKTYNLIKRMKGEIGDEELEIQF